ncbi:GWxTD domain-containing protein [Rubricoccus marinus]|uniref:GWxTD domain-containing protein n=1 Tax=Rubricoccus marinus TaxID=716817 RepID=A0A259TY85_9BACT|nr:GWxTD domain-containing protein [Rubricoccus marinus]OZC02671.1 hypothetical protein BSZ36_06600 [Rubricoccus marinus]
MRRLFLLALMCALAPLAHAQSSSVADLVQRGMAAFQDGRVAEAIRLLEQATDSPEADAEAYYRLGLALRARSPEQDIKRSRRAVARAVSLAPGNPEYLTAELEALRDESGGFFIELLRARERRQIAERLLEMDSTNAFAHEELATLHIAEYYRYRNAIWTSGAGFDPVGAFTSAEDERLADKPELDGDTGAGGLGDAEFDDPAFAEMDVMDGTNLATREAAAGDFAAARGNQFNLGLIRNLGSGSYTERADQARELALVHIRASLKSDPRRRSLYDDVMRLAALSGDWTLAGAPLAEMFVHFPDDPNMWLYLGLMNHRVGEWEAAAASFKNALEKMSAEERAVFEDLTYVLSPDQEKEYRASPEVYAARFWSSRDPRFLNPFNERRLEHYARLTTADLLYRSNDLNLPGWQTERGQIHVRYGVPKEDLIVEGDIGVVLERYADRNESFNAPEMFGLANRFNIWDYGDQQFVFEDPNRNGEYALYSPPADLFGLNVRGIDRMDYVLRARSAFRTNPERYDFEVPGREVYIPALVSAFRSSGREAEVYVHFGVPLAPEATGRDGTIPATIKTGAFLVGTDNVLLAERRKTLYGLRTDQVVPYKEVRLWVGSEQVTAPPGDYEVSVEFETANGTVAGVHREAVEVPDFTGTDLMLSSLLLAIQVEEGATAGPGRVQRGDFAIQPAPWGVYTVGDPIAVYFEVYGLGLDNGQSGYDVEAQLIPKDRSRGLARLAKRIFGGRARGVSTSFPAQGTSEEARQYVLLDATGQDPGVYTLTLRIEDRVSGQRTEREVDLLLE